MDGLNKPEIDFSKALAFSFFRRQPEIVAKELLGKILVRKEAGFTLAAMITETEAYISKDDLSCHAAVGKTVRNAAMFEAGGVLYVYKIYGVHHCINFVTEVEGVGSAVLIRSAEPLVGIERMMENRRGEGKREKVEGNGEKGEGGKEQGEGRREKGVKDGGIMKLCRGPGNLAKAFGFTREDNFRSLKTEELFIQNGYLTDRFQISVSERIGITKSADLLLRFFIENSAYVSGQKPNKR